MENLRKIWPHFSLKKEKTTSILVSNLCDKYDVCIFGWFSHTMYKPLKKRCISSILGWADRSLSLKIDQKEGIDTLVSHQDM